MFIVKLTRCTNFPNLLRHETTCFGQFLCPSSGVYSLYTQQWYMSYRFVDSCRAGPGWNCSSILVLLESCMTYTIAERTVSKLLMMDRGTTETCRVSYRNKFGKLVHLIGFIVKKPVTLFLLLVYFTFVEYLTLNYNLCLRLFRQV